MRIITWKHEVDLIGLGYRTLMWVVFKLQPPLWSTGRQLLLVGLVCVVHSRRSIETFLVFPICNMRVPSFPD
jgi:hypothetical protein